MSMTFDEKLEILLDEEGAGSTCTADEVREHIAALRAERDELRAVCAWAVSPRAVGVSAATIASVMLGVPLRGFDACHPLDPDDLRRCVGLLDAVPAFRSRLHEVAETYPRSAWPELVARWADLETLLRTETPPYRLEKTYRLMLECREAAEERTGQECAL